MPGRTQEYGMQAEMWFKAGASNLVFGEGSSKSGIMFIGEGPAPPKTAPEGLCRQRGNFWN